MRPFFAFVHLQCGHEQDHFCCHGYAEGPRKELGEHITALYGYEVEHVERKVVDLIPCYADLDDVFGVHQKGSMRM